MRRAPGVWLVFAAPVLLLAGCAAGGSPYAGPHLSPTECRDLAAFRTNAPPTTAQFHSGDTPGYERASQRRLRIEAKSI